MEIDESRAYDHDYGANYEGRLDLCDVLMEWSEEELRGVPEGSDQGYWIEKDEGPHCHDNRVSYKISEQAQDGPVPLGPALVPAAIRANGRAR